MPPRRPDEVQGNNHAPRRADRAKGTGHDPTAARRNPVNIAPTVTIQGLEDRSRPQGGQMVPRGPSTRPQRPDGTQGTGHTPKAARRGSGD